MLNVYSTTAKEIISPKFPLLLFELWISGGKNHNSVLKKIYHALVTHNYDILSQIYDEILSWIWHKNLKLWHTVKIDLSHNYDIKKSWHKVEIKTCFMKFRQVNYEMKTRNYDFLWMSEFALCQMSIMNVRICTFCHEMSTFHLIWLMLLL